MMSAIGRLASLLAHSLAVAGFYAHSRVAFRVKVNGMSNFKRRPSTIIVTNHKRDADGGLLGSTLCSGRGLFTTNLTLHYVSRDDLFRVGFLSKYVLSSAPGIVRRPLRYVSVGGLMRLLRVKPIAYLSERTVGDTLVDIGERMAQWSLDRVLTNHFLQHVREWAAVTEREGKRRLMTIRDSFRWPLWRALQRVWDPRFYHVEAFAELKATLRADIRQQIAMLASLLREGQSLFITPEGMLSKSGALGRIRYGLCQVIRDSGVKVRLLPVFVTYDWMTTRRTTAFVEVGAEVEGAERMSPKELNALVRERLRALGTITMGNLACAYILRCHGLSVSQVGLDELRERLFSLANDLARKGFRVDKRLRDRSDFDRCFEGFLGFCKKKGVVQVSSVPESSFDFAQDKPSAGRFALVASWLPDRSLSYGQKEFEEIAPQYAFEAEPQPA
ncbi:MAG: hypothetical protein AB1603_00035 [Chloroflexota bacterium]